MTVAITHDRAAHKFTTTVDGHEGYVEYEAGEGHIEITHTVVPKEIGGRGIAGELVKEALEFARSEGLKVVPRCSYAEGYMQKHSEYADLAA
ncbi:MAG: N-acetyltransferase [Pseudomonadota bacterium]|nr:N-acetyltransferase [Pseudomonadota bacterium]MDQ3228174.1 N-acetyltransferase [Pseudomonadota bacterium]